MPAQTADRQQIQLVCLMIIRFSFSRGSYPRYVLLYGTKGGASMCRMDKNRAVYWVNVVAVPC